jgi:hypothetical protein
MQGKVEHAPRLPKGINTPLGRPRRVDPSIHTQELGET